MQIELDDALKAALEKRANDAGMNVAAYANMIVHDRLREDTVAAEIRHATVDAYIEHMKTSQSHSGRAEKSWRDFIHEEHAE